jgi:hypothetical protein
MRDEKSWHGWGRLLVEKPHLAAAFFKSSIVCSYFTLRQKHQKRRQGTSSSQQPCTTTNGGISCPHNGLTEHRSKQGDTPCPS